MLAAILKGTGNIAISCYAIKNVLRWLRIRKSASLLLYYYYFCYYKKPKQQIKSDCERVSTKEKDPLGSVCLTFTHA
jgi:hypothetical protein